MNSYLACLICQAKSSLNLRHRLNNETNSGIVGCSYARQLSRDQMVLECALSHEMELLSSGEWESALDLSICYCLSLMDQENVDSVQVM